MPALLRWLTELMWLPPDEGLPQGHSPVSFMELALDFESHAGRPLPPSPRCVPREQSRLCKRKGGSSGWRSPSWAEQWGQSQSRRRPSPPSAGPSSHWGRER